mmetsp:Transcript_34489/g.86636  ORF Transcript_34489/g.86636 Transcript_34489/m.86636 type:complete len:209 (+) Transcript_34489:966-1592(+)
MLTKEERGVSDAVSIILFPLREVLRRRSKRRAEIALLLCRESLSFFLRSLVAEEDVMEEEEEEEEELDELAADELGVITEPGEDEAPELGPVDADAADDTPMCDFDVPTNRCEEERPRRIFLESKLFDRGDSRGECVEPLRFLPLRDGVSSTGFTLRRPSCEEEATREWGCGESEVRDRPREIASLLARAGDSLRLRNRFPSTSHGTA